MGNGGASRAASSGSTFARSGSVSCPIPRSSRVASSTSMHRRRRGSLHPGERRESEAGMVALQNDDYWYFLAIGRDRGRRVIRLRQRAGGQDPMAGTIVASQPLPEAVR